jgi:hypothetical protein
MGYREGFHLGQIVLAVAELEGVRQGERQVHVGSGEHREPPVRWSVKFHRRG